MIKVAVLYSVAGVATQILLSHESGDILVDAGDGVTRDLLRIGYDFYRLEAILLTHEDFDHVSGLWALLNFLKNFYRHRRERLDTLSIVLPKPVHHVHLMMMPPLIYTDLGFPIRLFEVIQGENILIGTFKIRPFAVNHEKPSRKGVAHGGNLGYSIWDREGFKVVLSGDTRPCSTLEEEAEGADVAVLEASARDGDLQKAIEQGHMTKSEAEEIGSKAKNVIYIHQPPDWFV